MPTNRAGTDLFFAHYDAHNRRISLRVALIDMGDGDHLAALVLTHIVDQHLRAKAGEIPARHDEGLFWLQITHADWWQITRLRRRQIQHVLKKLCDLHHMVKTRVFGVSHGRSASHVALLERAFHEKWEQLEALLE